VIGGLIAWHEIDPRLDLSVAWPAAIIAFGIFPGHLVRGLAQGRVAFHAFGSA